MSFTGIVYELAGAGIARLIVPKIDLQQTLLRATGGDAWNVLFAVNGPDESEVRAATEAVAAIAQQLMQPIPPETGRPASAGERYVYAYFHEGRALWPDCFYIGKGTAKQEVTHLGRWTEHVRDTLETPANAHTTKMRNIHRWLVAQGLEGAPAGQARQRAAGELVRMLQVFAGTHAETQAFYVEYFLITWGLGVHHVSNDTNGNSSCGSCTAIARPRHFEQGVPTHEAIWAGTVACFTEDANSPALKNTWRPAALVQVAAPSVARLDALLAPIGLRPHPMFDQGRLRDAWLPLPHLQVTGASDATFTYSHPQRPHYRIELRFGATDWLTSISLRPVASTRASITAFLDYLDRQRVSLAQVGDVRSAPDSDFEHWVQNRKYWPYFKPYAPRGKGTDSAWFDVSAPEQPREVRADWIENGTGRLSLRQALELIVRAFD